MDYSKRGIQRKRRRLHASGDRIAHKATGLITHLILISVIGVAVMVLCFGIGAFKGVIDTAPDIKGIDVKPSGFSTFVYDTDGNQTAKLVSTDANRIPVSKDMIPVDLMHAFVAIEDERFYEHSGIDIPGIIRAGVKGVTNVLHGGKMTEGASTITQQLIKNNVFTGWTSESFVESVRRKIQEQYLAIELEKHMSKEDILVNYLNTINLGHNTLGVQAASLRYFGKSVADLTISESAVIASITQNPTAYDPIVFPEKNKARREEVLKKMYAQEYITKEQYETALADDVYSRIQVVDAQTEDEQVNSYFVDALTNQLLDDLQKAGYTEQQAFTLLYSGGLSIYSTQDARIQKICDDVCSDPANFPASTTWSLTYAVSILNDDETMSDYSGEMMQQWFIEQTGRPDYILNYASQDDAYAAIEEYKAHLLESGGEVYLESVNLVPQPQISLTIEDQHTGNIVAMVGGRGAKTASRTFNRSTDAMKQPGSTFKIIASYAPALDAGGMSLANIQIDEPYTYEDGTKVRNWYGEAYRGPQTLRQGIESSLNIVAVKTLTDIGVDLGFEYTKKFGFTTVYDSIEIGGKIYSDRQQTLALGGLTKGVKNYELNAAYAAIANGGEYIEPKLYTRVTDHDGNVILDADEYRDEHRVIKETTAWLLIDAMKDVVSGAQGTARSINFGTTPIAGKTGTTEGYNDVWFAGFTDYYTATTWAGYDNNEKKLAQGEERALAQSIWRKCMEPIHEGLESRDFNKPSGLVQFSVCGLSGKKATSLCGDSVRSDWFDEENIPEESCDAHYAGLVCEYTGLPAADACPFQVNGVVALQHGQIGQKCPHDSVFMSTPEGAAVVAQQKAELDTKHIAESQGAAALAVQQAQATLDQAVIMYDQAVASGDEAAIMQAAQTRDLAQQAYDNAFINLQAAMAAGAGGGDTDGDTGGEAQPEGGGE